MLVNVAAQEIVEAEVQGSTARRHVSDGGRRAHLMIPESLAIGGVAVPSYRLDEDPERGEGHEGQEGEETGDRSERHDRNGPWQVP